MKKKKICGLLSLSMGSLILFSGCAAKPITLSSAIANSQNIKSYSYDLTVAIKENKSGNDNKTEAALQNYGLLQDGKFTLEAKGQAKDTGDREKLSSTIKFSMGGASIEDPIFLDGGKKDNDFNLIIGVPGVFKSMLGDALKDVSNIYISSKSLGDFIKQTQGEQAYKQYEDSLKSNNNAEATQISKDLVKVVGDYVENTKGVEKYQPIDKLSKSENGIYTITLSKTDLKNLAASYLNNEQYFKNLKAALNKSSALSGNNSSLKDMSAKDMIAKVNSALDQTKGLKLEITATIKDKYVVETDIKLSTDEVSFDVDDKINDINKIGDIQMPDKNAKGTLDITKLYEQVISSFTGGASGPISESN